METYEFGIFCVYISILLAQQRVNRLTIRVYNVLMSATVVFVNHLHAVEMKIVLN